MNVRASQTAETWHDFPDEVWGEKKRCCLLFIKYSHTPLHCDSTTFIKLTFWIIEGREETYCSLISISNRTIFLVRTALRKLSSMTNSPLSLRLFFQLEKWSNLSPSTPIVHPHRCFFFFLFRAGKAQVLLMTLKIALFQSGELVSGSLYCACWRHRDTWWKDQHLLHLCFYSPIHSSTHLQHDWRPNELVNVQGL